MGTWTIYLNKHEEEEIQRLIAKRQFISVYAFIRQAVRRALENAN